ncbi:MULTISPECIES: alpha/beta fold hydrolase [unclassified Streptomyces]|uniref:alpha/beta fold hydrolase n=1 Tax=unclassified Streptomyces TaxID=2593676 RepID=UPI00037DB26D|nr:MULTISPECIES: alpha/beta fold hydrolase [unclassified Streptomyces]MYT32557.1 alpha/beta fold hydrolase [Streptomyces sp. SID8354]
MSTGQGGGAAQALYKSQAGAEEILRRYQAALETWPVPAEHVRVPTGQGETFVVVSGPADAPPLVLLHGSGANATMWLGDIAGWSRHFRTYAVDVIGEPGLSAPARPSLASEDPARWLDEVLDGLGISTTAVVGTSLGGWLALDYARRRPERVTRLALLCPGGIGRQKVGWLFRALLLRVLGRKGVERSVRKGAGLEDPGLQPVLDTVVLVFTHFRPRTERLPIVPDEALRRLAMPVLVIAGARDALFDSAGTARRVRACVPRATVHLLPEAGHALFGQTDTVLDFLREPEPADQPKPPAG